MEWYLLAGTNKSRREIEGLVMMMMITIMICQSNNVLLPPAPGLSECLHKLNEKLQAFHLEVRGMNVANGEWIVLVNKVGRWVMSITGMGPGLT